ncbi:PEBP-like protein [Trametopsis cervina]|nr:PEBP-like protein [Trametopsis cervina]
MAYKTLLACILLSLISLVASQDWSIAEVKAAFNKAKIPEDAFITFNPKLLLEVSFPGKSGRPVKVHAGEHVHRNDTAGAPRFTLVGGLPRHERYVVATVDLDHPTPQDPSLAQVRHFLGGNFRPVWVGPKQQLVNTTAALSDWFQPSPPEGSDPHRYVFLVFDQPASWATQTLVTPNTTILQFNISSFAAGVGLGNPIAGTYMHVSADY